MQIVDLIRRKRDGRELSAEQLEFLVDGYTEGDIPDYQMAAFLMATYFESFTADELTAWTKQMLDSGDVLDFSAVPGPKIDKHSTGGVGDKVSLVLTPLAITAGLHVPMISGRGLGHTGGTLDKLESIPGYDVNLSSDHFRQLVAEIGGAIIGQTDQIAPADKKLYALRDVTGTVESIPLISSSIMSKKLAEGIDGLVLDVKVGSGAFMKDIGAARKLAETMIQIGESMGCKVGALITDMDQPLGYTVGNALEVRESIETLRGNGPEDLTQITIELVTEMLALGDRIDDRDAVRPKLRELLDNGSAFEIFRTMVDAQGGDPEVCDDPDDILPTSDHVVPFEADQSGIIRHIDAEKVGLAAMSLGAGREQISDTIDHAVGLVFERKRGDAVDAGEPILHIHHNDRKRLDACRTKLEEAIEITDSGVEEPPIVLERVDS